MFVLEPQSIDFVERAPLRVADSATVNATRPRVFEAFANTEGWPRWFPLMTKARWLGAEQRKVGAVREVSLVMLGTYREKFIAWEPNERFTFTMTESSSPFARAIVEDFKFSDVEGGRATRIEWVLAADPRAVGRVLKPVLEITMRRVFRSSGPKLEKHLRA